MYLFVLFFLMPFRKVNFITSEFCLSFCSASALNKPLHGLLSTYLFILNLNKISESILYLISFPLFITLTHSIRQLLLLIVIALSPVNLYAISNTGAKPHTVIYRNTKIPVSQFDKVHLPILPKTVTIPGGCFQMGSHQFELNRNTDETRHRVCIKRFQMAVNEVTVAEFKSFVKATNYITDAEIDFQARGCWSYDESQKEHWSWQPWANWINPLKIKLNDNNPVTCVSFYDIAHYITWLNKITGHTYRLPTEAEWEYAARAGSNNLYFWGNNPDLSCRYANTADLSEFLSLKWPETNHCHDHFFFSAPVKQYLPNKFGLYDILGNVWEWTCSEYQKEYQGQEQQCIKNEEERPVFIAVRGGGWNAGPSRIRLAYRNWESPWVRMTTWGFRLVKVNNYSLKLKKQTQRNKADPARTRSNRQ